MKHSPLENMPELMKNTDSWLVANADKIPVRPCSFQRLSGDKASCTLGFQDAVDLVNRGVHDYAVLLHTDQHPIASIDIDSCQTATTHELKTWCHAMITDNKIGYMESSSSGTGLRICCVTQHKTIGKRCWFINKNHYHGPAPANAEKVEIMIANNTLAAYTGNVHPMCTAPDEMTELEPMIEWLDQHYPAPPRELPNPEAVPRDYQRPDRDQILAALDYISPDIHHDEWKHIGMALHDWDPVDGLGIWIHWSSASDKFKGNNDCRIAWNSFSQGGITVSTLFHHARNNGYRPAKEPETVISPVNQPETVIPDNLPPIPLINGIDVMNMPVVPCLVDGLLPSTGFAQMFGESGSFKSFLALDLAMAVVSGSQWFSRSVDQGSVVYLCGEGIYGMRARLSAWTSKGIDADMRQLLMSAYIPDLTNLDVLGRLTSYLKMLPDLKVIIIDTFARAMVHIGNESDNSDVGRYNRIIDYIRHQVKVLLLQVHHTGHANKDRSRGASSLYAALDAEYQCVKLGERDGYLKCTKAKDFPEPEIINFSMTPVADSLIVKERVKPIPTSRQEAMANVRSEQLTERQLNVVRIYEALYALHETNANSNDKVTPRVLYKDLNDQLVSSGVCARDHASRDIKSLIKKKVLTREGHYIRMN